MKFVGGYFSYLQVPGGYPPAFMLFGDIYLAHDLSIFVDESGGRGGKARHYLLTLVIHGQSEGTADKITRYVSSSKNSTR